MQLEAFPVGLPTPATMETDDGLAPGPFPDVEMAQVAGRRCSGQVIRMDGTGRHRWALVIPTRLPFFCSSGDLGAASVQQCGSHWWSWTSLNPIPVSTAIPAILQAHHERPVSRLAWRHQHECKPAAYNMAEGGCPGYFGGEPLALGLRATFGCGADS
jgi:hypothetical protein